MTMVTRVFITAIIFVVVGLFAAFYQPTETIVLAEIAGHQFDNSDSSAILAQGGFGIVAAIRAGISLAMIALLLAIWWGPLKTWWAHAMAALMVFLALAIAAPREASAYYDKTDYAEVYLVLPNESAFWIPDTGANATTQTNMDSEAYLSANKIATKRFTIPHAVLPGSGWFSGYFVPTGRLIVVDRTPYHREWTKSAARGTQATDQSFPCQTSEGLNVTVEIGVAASVAEQNAAKFLYYFGVRPPPGDRSKPEVIFTSVYQGRSLEEVMDGVARGKISSLVCAEIGRRTLDKANADINLVMQGVETGATEFMASRGITLDYIGWAGTWEFDAPVQDAINRRYISTQDKQVAELLQPYVETIMTLAVADGLRAAVGKFDGKLPQTLSGLWLFPSNWIENIAGAIKANTPATQPQK
jgi:hypothetical protein